MFSLFWKVEETITDYFFAIGIAICYKNYIYYRLPFTAIEVYPTTTILLLRARQMCTGSIGKYIKQKQNARMMGLHHLNALWNK